MESDNDKTQEQKNGSEKKDYYSSINIDKYKDPEGLSIKKLSFGLWYLEHKKLLLNILYVFLGTIGLFSWGAFFITFGHYVLVGMNYDNRMIAEMLETNISHETVMRSSPGQIKVKSAEVIINSTGTYDLLAKISNQSDRHYASLDYTFSFNNTSLGPFKDFILPAEEKFLIVLNQDLNRRPNSLKVDLSPKWNRVDGHIIKDWKVFRDNFIDFSVENKTFYNPKESNLSEKLDLSTVEFDLTNNSAYSYYMVNLDILLYSRGRLVAVNKYPVEKLKSGETRHINVTWPGKVTRVDTIEVRPNVNIMEQGITFIP